METAINFLGSSFKLIDYGQKALSLVPNFFEKSNKEAKTELLDITSTLIKLGIVWLSEKSNPCPTQATKLTVGNHSVTVLFPEYFQGVKRWGVSVENLESIYICIEAGLKQKAINPEEAHNLLYLRVGALGLRALGDVYKNRYIVKNDKRYAEAQEKLQRCAEKIEKYIESQKEDFGLEKFFPTKKEKLYDIEVEDSSENKPVASFEVKSLFQETDHVIISSIFKEAFEPLLEKYPRSAMHFAQSLNSYMIKIDSKYQVAVSEIYRN